MWDKGRKPKSRDKEMWTIKDLAERRPQENIRKATDWESQRRAEGRQYKDWKHVLFLNIYFYLFTYLLVLGLSWGTWDPQAYELFRCGMWDPVSWLGIETWCLGIEPRSLELEWVLANGVPGKSLLKTCTWMVYIKIIGDVAGSIFGQSGEAENSIALPRFHDLFQSPNIAHLS